MNKLLLLTASAITAAAQQSYELGPDSQLQLNTPKGTVSKHTLAPGKYFPGTPHNYSLYVPKQYDAAKPTPFMIFLDGSGALGGGVRAPIVFDNLIAKGDLPPMIGIFIDPGVLPAQGDVQSRFERVFEYDSLSDRFANFLVDELITEVSKSYNLSKDPNDRGISGVSTGAVGAFAAAWNRPDQFRRVLSFIGTFVAMKGADGLPALIRKTETKPIRIFLQAGKNDHIAPNQPWGTFYGGSWPINNQVMLEAFQFAGYDAKLVLGDEGHNMKHGGAILPEALRWLWRGYPAPITVKDPEAMTQPGWDPRGKVSSIVSASSKWEKVVDSARSVTLANDGHVYAATTAGVVQLGGAEVKLPGVTLLRGGPNGVLYSDGSSIGIVNGKVLSPNSGGRGFAVTAKGDVYYTIDNAIYRIEPSGKTVDAWYGNELSNPAGIAISPDQGMLVVTDSMSRFSWSFQIAADGKLINGEPFYRLEMPETGWRSYATAAAFDSIGQVYFATAVGIQMCEANGRVAAILNSPSRDRVTDIAFASHDNQDWLYAVAGAKLYRRAVKVKGVPAWAPAKLPRPPL